MDMILYLFGITIAVLGIAAIWDSELQLQERRKNYRAGTHDYYGNRIK